MSNLKDEMPQNPIIDESIALYKDEISLWYEATALENKLIVAYIPKAETKALRLPDGSVDDAKVQAWFAAHEDDEQ